MWLKFMPYQLVISVGAASSAAHAPSRFTVSPWASVTSDRFTLGGLVTEAIGHLPETGDELSLDRFVFRVARADARRVQAFHVTVLPADTDNED